MATGERIDPYAGFNFLVEIDGITRAAFSECSGLSTDTDPIEYRDGSEDITVRKIPGLKKFANISLKRGMTKDMELWTWRKTVLDGVTERKAGSIVLFNEARELLIVPDCVVGHGGPILCGLTTATAMMCSSVQRQ